MSDLRHDVVRLLERELQGFERELALFPDDQSLWQTLPGIANAAGNLALHVAGNLQHYVGAVLGGTGYIRNREREFSHRCSRSEVSAELQNALGVVRNVLPRLPEISLDRIYPEASLEGARIRTNLFLLHLCTHAAYHLGQAGYLRRILTADNRSSGAIRRASLDE